MSNLSSVLSYYIPNVLSFAIAWYWYPSDIASCALFSWSHETEGKKTCFGDDTELGPNKRNAVKDFPVKFFYSRMNKFMQKEKYVPLYLAFFLP